MIGRTLGQYYVDRMLHDGSTCTLYVAQDQNLERDVVIKVLNDSQAVDEEVKLRFLREARSAAVLEHPNICSVFAMQQTSDGLLYFVMPFYRGQTLREKIDGGHLTLELALSVAEQVALALGYAHSHGIVHRDLKPENIFITSESLVKLLDFGVAKLENYNITRAGSVMGTVAYMAPEQIEGKPASIQSDVWAWGTVLYEMLAGQVPFAHIQGIDMMLAIRDKAVPALPEPLLEGADALTYQPLLDRCLARDANNRASSMRDVLRYLAPLASTRASTHLATLAPSTIPVWHKPFVGREDLLDSLQHQLTAGARLITLSGQAGIGKTHAALTFLYGTDLHLNFPDGLLYIAAEPVTATHQDTHQDTYQHGSADNQQANLADAGLDAAKSTDDGTTSDTTSDTANHTVNTNAGSNVRFAASATPQPQEDSYATASTGDSAQLNSQLEVSSDLDKLAERIAKVLRHELTHGSASYDPASYEEHETSVGSLPMSERDPATRAQAWAQALAKIIGKRQLLLLIDGLTYPPAVIGQLLEALSQHCEQLVIMVTARSRLAVSSERVVNVGALALPSGPEDLSRSASAQLFLSTTSRHLDDDERADLAQLCHLLGGWPAALELAAQWHIHRNCAALIEAVTAFNLATRQGLVSLRALLETMWQSLSWQEAAALARLSSLGEQSSAETASYIAEVPLNLLTALVDKNMLEVHSDVQGSGVQGSSVQGNGVQGSVYYANPLIVQYAQYKLAAAPNLHAVLKQRLADYLARRLAGDAPATLSVTAPSIWQRINLNAQTRLSQVEWRNLQAAWQVWLERPPKRFLTMISRLSQLASYAYEDRTVARLFARAQHHFGSHLAQVMGSSVSLQPHVSLASTPTQAHATATRVDHQHQQQHQQQQRHHQRLQQLVTMLSVYEARHHLRLGDASRARTQLAAVIRETLEQTLSKTASKAYKAGATSRDNTAISNTTSSMTSNPDMTAYQRPPLELSLYPALAGLILLQTDDYDAACQVYRWLNRSYPDSRLVYGDPLFLQLLGLLAAHLEPEKLPQARHLFALSAASYRDDQDSTGEALAKLSLGFLAWSQSDLQQAASYLQQALNTAQLPTLNTLQARVLLAEVYFEQGKWQAAMQDFDDVHSQALQLPRSPASLVIASDALAGLAKVASAQGDTIVAHAYLQQAMGHAHYNPWRSLESVAAIFVRRKDIDDAALVLAHLASYPASKFKRDTGLELPLPELRTRQSVAALIEQVQLFMNDANWQAVKTQAEAMSLEMLLEHVQNQLAASDYSF